MGARFGPSSFDWDMESNHWLLLLWQIRIREIDGHCGRNCTRGDVTFMAWGRTSRFLHVQINSLCDYADSLKLITFVVFLLWVIENCKSALPEKSPQYHSGVGRHPGMPFLNLSNTYRYRCCGPSSRGPRRRLLQSTYSTDAWIMLCSNRKRTRENQSLLNTEFIERLNWLKQCRCTYTLHAYCSC